MSDDDKVIFLAVSNDLQTVRDAGHADVLSCRTCRNKTYVVTYFEGQRFPSLRCACCQSDAGLIGWVQED